MALSSDYEVRVAGIVGPAAREAFADLDIRIEETSTVLSGALDQAALHGIIERVAALGLELVDIRRTSSAGGSPGSQALLASHDTQRG
ncbi:hypothetical protein [Humibacillus xanthopallidus]|uniref:Uncharacterized protein n=1 Tax=Humibacillus xanthopallidus TaxID=412689 RepID=A0A543HU24_9MICO|nr:hypothetical protein [Humibacillus xanthopallidus]TQM61851.1 hypothetical protein FBY41_1871 [Humibacillus xanthopallidus]